MSVPCYCGCEEATHGVAPLIASCAKRVILCRKGLLDQAGLELPEPMMAVTAVPAGAQEVWPRLKVVCDNSYVWSDIISSIFLRCGHVQGAYSMRCVRARSVGKVLARLLLDHAPCSHHGWTRDHDMVCFSMRRNVAGTCACLLSHTSCIVVAQIPNCCSTCINPNEKRSSHAVLEVFARQEPAYPIFGAVTLHVLSVNTCCWAVCCC